MEYRKKLIFRELQGYNADIVCLQEVDAKIFTKNLSPLFAEWGFDGMYCGKYRYSTSEERTNAADDSEMQAANDPVKPIKPGSKRSEFEVSQEGVKTKSIKEGCATFYRKSKFRCVGQFDANVTEQLKKDSELWTKISTNTTLTESLEKRTTVVQATLLEQVSSPDKKMLVLASHFFFHPRANNIRLLQTLGCVKLVQSILKTRQSEDISVLFCGDLNSHHLSAVHELLTKGVIKSNHVDWFSGGKREFVEDMSLETNMTFTSACGYPQYTNFVPSFNGCLDYIYIDHKLKAERVIPLPSHEEVTQCTALPNKLFPSDHLALVCDVSWK